MNTTFKLFAAFVLAFAVSSAAFARGGGGGSNLLTSPGYQRALKESREKYAEPQYVRVPAHARTRHRHHRR